MDRPPAPETACKSGPLESPGGMDAEAKLLEAFTSVPVLNKATLRKSNDGSLQIMAQVSQHNLPANGKRQLLYTAHLPDPQDVGRVLCSSLPLELPASTLTSVAPSGDAMLVSKAHSDGVLLELWRGGRLERELLVPKSLHGPVVNDGWFSRGAAWSPDESRVAYVAESPAPQRTPLWCGSDAKDAAAPRGWRGVSEAEADWGELNTGKRPPTLYVLDTSSYTVHKVQGLPPHSCGQPTWTPDGEGLVFVAWPHKHPNLPQTARRLGIVFCYNRPCSVMYVPYGPPPPAATAAAAPAPDAPDVGAEAAAPVDAAVAAAPEPPPAVDIAPGLLAAAAPLFTPGGDELLLLSFDAAATSGVHNATAALVALPWPQATSGCATPRTIVGVVRRPEVFGTSFPGLYAGGFVDSPFVGPRTLLLSSQFYSHTAILAIDLDSGAVAPATPTDAAAGSWTLQGVADGVAAAVLSAPSAPPKLMLARAPPPGPGGELPAPGAWRWTAVSALEPRLTGALEPVAAALADLEAVVLDVTPTVGDASFTFQAVVQAPRRGAHPGAPRTPLPAVVVPHGGPHSSISANYYLPFGFLTALGYCVVAVNFRGSTGFGEDSLQSLPGAIGTNDVEDCVAALDAAIAAGYVDKDRVSVIGGSHGGFLTGHLMGQHPERFRCAGLRNPVLNIALMVGLSDIPDWCYVEVLGTEEGKRRFSPAPTSEDLTAMLAASPIAHVSKVTGPMMFLVGSKDRRVPEDDGRRYADAAASNGVITRLLVFPEDTHGLDKPQTEYEQWLNLAWWMKLHAAAKGAEEA